MANTIKVTPQKEKIPENEGSETLPDSPLLDLSDAVVKELIRSAKKRDAEPSNSHGRAIAGW